MAADAAAHGIREVDPEGTIIVLSGDPHLPYNRPPLSKGLWKGEDVASVARANGDPRREVHLGRLARTLDPGLKKVTDDRGDEYTYRRLLLATGGEPRRLRGAPDDVIYFRTLDDYRRTRELSDGGARFLIVGGGFIGAEMAAALSLQGRDVTMIIPEDGICARLFPPLLAKFVTDYYRERGPTLLLGDSVGRIEERGAGFLAHTANGATIEADAIIAGIGITPNVDLAAQAGIRTDNGIVVDEQLRTSKPDIFAAGDVANFFSPALGRRVRVEHEDNANTMGRIAGHNLAGAGERYDHLPFFYGDLFDLGYEAVGDLDGRLETYADWKEPFREGVIYYLDGKRVRGVLLWNTWGQVDAARSVIGDGTPVEAGSLKGRIG
jgi:NADPH-dependent 2,4-dienoyl-CoA reductase/sulfur reductase-like enzyme